MSIHLIPHGQGDQSVSISPLSRFTLFNTAVTANTNISGSYLTPTYPTSLFRIEAAFTLSGVLKVIKRSGGVNVTLNLNQGASLTGSALYAFDIVVNSGESIDVQYSASTTALSLSITELVGII